MVYFWIGFNTVNKNNYEWTDSTQVNFTNWWGGEPNNFNNNEQCAQIRPNGRWNDATCSVNLGWICKINKGVNPTTTQINVPPTYAGILNNLIFQKSHFYYSKLSYRV